MSVSCLVYFAERDEGVWSFVDSFWFALMTLTTVGYDLNPATMLGKVTGGFCALLGKQSNVHILILLFRTLQKRCSFSKASLFKFYLHASAQWSILTCRNYHRNRELFSS